MGFFDSLKRALGHRGADQSLSHPHPQGPDPALARAWGLDVEPGHPEGGHAADAEASEYDRGQWVRKLKRVLAGLPETGLEWEALAADARALNLEPEWVKQTEAAEFRLMIRRAVSDGRFTDKEHRKLDLARDLIGIPDAEAEALLKETVAEAEAFFGKQVEGA